MSAVVMETHALPLVELARISKRFGEASPAGPLGRAGKLVSVIPRFFFQSEAKLGFPLLF